MLVRRPSSATLKAFTAGALGALVTLGAAAGLYVGLAPKQLKLTQENIDAAVEHSLQEAVLPSPAAKAYEAIRPRALMPMSTRPVSHPSAGSDTSNVGTQRK